MTIRNIPTVTFEIDNDDPGEYFEAIRKGVQQLTRFQVMLHQTNDENTWALRWTDGNGPVRHEDRIELFYVADPTDHFHSLGEALSDLDGTWHFYAEYEQKLVQGREFYILTMHLDKGSEG